jgi:hypothetical protein
MHVDYHGFDQIIINNCYPLLLILGLFKYLIKQKYSQKLAWEMFTILYTLKRVMNGKQHYAQCWLFQIQCYAFWSYECPYNFSKHDE